jgi:cytoplasmic iron level regulating protein YaaA (DUF328/UPF0246 family)
MARYIVRNRLTEAERLLGFAEEGYEHDPELSEPLQPVFTRTKAAAAAAG